MEKPPSKVLFPNTPNIQDIAIPIPNYKYPYIEPKGDTSTKMIDRKMIQDVGREISIYPDVVYRPPPKPVKNIYTWYSWKLVRYWPRTEYRFEDNSPFQEGVISEMYQRPDMSYSQGPQ